MAVERDLHGVGNGLARNERVMHAFVVHGNAIAHTDGGDLERHAACQVDAGLYRVSNLVKVVVPRNDVVSRVDHRNEGTLHLLVGHAVRLEQAAVWRACNAFLHGVAAKLHGATFLSFAIPTGALLPGVRAVRPNALPTSPVGHFAPKAKKPDRRWIRTNEGSALPAPSLPRRVRSATLPSCLHRHSKRPLRIRENPFGNVQEDVAASPCRAFRGRRYLASLLLVRISRQAPWLPFALARCRPRRRVTVSPIQLFALAARG